jgi:hypothetical protein
MLDYFFVHPHLSDVVRLAAIPDRGAEETDNGNGTRALGATATPVGASAYDNSISPGFADVNHFLSDMSARYVTEERREDVEVVTRYLQDSGICDWYAHYQYIVAMQSAVVTEMMAGWIERRVDDYQEGIEQLRRSLSRPSWRGGVLERAQLDVQHTEEEIMKNRQKLAAEVAMNSAV